MSEEALRIIIEKEVRHYVQTGGKINRLAAKTGLTGPTVSRLAYGETKYPRIHTVIAVLHYFGYSVTAHKTSANQHVRVMK